LYDKITNFACPLILPWYPWYWFRNDETLVRKLGSRFVWFNTKSGGAKNIVIFKSLVWPFVALLGHIMDWACNAGEVKRVFKVGIISQLGKRLWFLCWRGYGPVPFCCFYFYEYGKHSNYDRFLSGRDVSRLNVAVVRGVDSEAVDNKLRFYLRCMELGYAMVPVYAVFKNGGIGDEVTFSKLPQEDLYFKLSQGMAGYNIERWKWSEATQLWSHLEQSLNEQSLLDHFKALSETGTYILQPSAKHHSFFEGMSEEGVCTLRVLSLCSIDKEIEVVHNYIAIPVGDSPINHGPRGGLKVKMNLKTHCLENLVWSTPTLGVSTTHPVTGEQIFGKRLDCWPEVEAFVKAAHLEFPDCFSIAWDIIYTPDGIQILEGNTQWGLINGCFIGESNYPQWIIEKLKTNAEKLPLFQYMVRGL